jgi:hypothetical protein
MKRGQTESVTLAAGFVLAVTCDANSTALVAREPDSVGGGQSMANSIAAGTTNEFGPFDHTTRWTIYAQTGPSTVFAVSVAAALVSLRIIQASITPASVAASGGAEQSFAVAGANALDKVCAVSGNTGNAVGIAGARVTGADTVAVKFVNPTAGALTPGAGTYSFLLAR